MSVIVHARGGRIPPFRAKVDICSEVYFAAIKRELYLHQGGALTVECVFSVVYESVSYLVHAVLGYKDKNYSLQGSIRGFVLTGLINIANHERNGLMPIGLNYVTIGSKCLVIPIPGMTSQRPSVVDVIGRNVNTIKHSNVIMTAGTIVITNRTVNPAIKAYKDANNYYLMHQSVYLTVSSISSYSVIDSVPEDAVEV